MCAHTQLQELNLQRNYKDSAVVLTSYFNNIIIAFNNIITAVAMSLILYDNNKKELLLTKCTISSTRQQVFGITIVMLQITYSDNKM